MPPPATPTFFAHSRPEWTFSPIQCAAPEALAFAQSTAAPALPLTHAAASPALCLAQSTAAPALWLTQLAPCCTAPQPLLATFAIDFAPCLMLPHALLPAFFRLPQALPPAFLAAFQRPCALLEIQLLA